MINKPPDILLQSILRDAFDTEATATTVHPIDDEELLLRWADRRLSDEENADMLEHLAACSACRKGVAEMIEHGILEFQDRSDSENFAPESVMPVIRKKHRYFNIFILGGAMTSTLCLLLCLFFLQSDGENIDIARNDPPSVQNGRTDLDAKLGGVSCFGGEPDKFALLIGIDRYGKLKEAEWLDGCRNDIAELKTLVTERFGFDPGNITTLLDEQATAEGVRGAMKELTDRVRRRPEGSKPAQVLFYFSGHGSRIPDQPEGHPDCDAEDGFDSTLVVYDSEQQGSETDIRDDELNKFAHDICGDGKAELLIALDSCHSGGGARGVTKFRGLSRSLETTVSAGAKNRKITPKKLPEGTVFLSACQSNQKEPEFEVDGKKYGLFSYHLTKLLQTEQLVSSLDYTVLKDIIHRSYQRNKIAQAPTPTIEGNLRDLKKPILGADRSVDRKPYWEAKRDGNKRDSLRLEAGRINDITEHSLFELFESAEQTLDPNAKSLGWFRIVKVDGKYSLGDFFQWKDVDRTEAVDSVLPNEFKIGFAVERYHDYGDNVLAVRVVDAKTGRTVAPNSETIPEPVRSALLGSDSKDESNWIRWTGDGESCDVVVKYDGAAKIATIFPSTGNVADDIEAPKTRGSIAIPEPLRGGWGPIEWGSERGKSELISSLRRIMKALSLKRLAAEKIEPVKTRGGPVEAKLQTAVLRYNVESGETRPIAIDSRNGIVLEGGKDDFYQIRIRNNDDKPVYISILCIDPDMQIAAFALGPESNPLRFDPEIGVGNNPDVNRLEPGEEFVSLFGFEAPFGAHTLIVFATRERSDFSFLSQDGLIRLRGTKGAASQILEFVADQCQIGTRATIRPPVPRDDSWFINSVDVIVEPR